MPLFYRLEDCYRYGVYASIETKVRQAIIDFIGTDDAPDKACHPLPDNDSVLAMNLKANGISPFMAKDGRCRFGFVSINQLRAWFYDDSFLIKAGAAGLFLSTYEVPDIVAGNAQACILAKYHSDEFLIEKIPANEIVEADPIVLNNH